MGRRRIESERHQLAPKPRSTGRIKRQDWYHSKIINNYLVDDRTPPPNLGSCSDCRVSFTCRDPVDLVDSTALISLSICMAQIIFDDFVEKSSLYDKAIIA